MGKVQWRITRFVRSTCPNCPMTTAMSICRAWPTGSRPIFAVELTGEEGYLEKARRSADYMVAVAVGLRASAASADPVISRRRWKASGPALDCWPCTGLTRSLPTLKPPRNGTRFRPNRSAFRRRPRVSANYYAHSTILVPNVTTMLIWLCAELVIGSGDTHFGTYLIPMPAIHRVQPVGQRRVAV